MVNWNIRSTDLRTSYIGSILYVLHSSSINANFRGDSLMPIYIYECVKCGKQFEGMASVKLRNDIRHCMVCDYLGKHKIIIKYAPGVILRGSGFYKTDNKDFYDEVNEDA